MGDTLNTHITCNLSPPHLEQKLSDASCDTSERKLSLNYFE